MSEQAITPITEADKWLYAALLASPVGSLVDERIYLDPAPAEAPEPLIVFSLLSGTDLRGVGPATMWADLLYQVKVIDKGRSRQRAAPIAAAISQALHAQRGETELARIVACERVGHIGYPEQDEGGALYQHLGYEFRIKVRPKPA